MALFFNKKQKQRLTMTILHISDTHNCHKELGTLPEADVIVHSGDFTRDGTEEEAYDFINWLCDLPYKHKVFIAGNHDLCLRGAEGIEGLSDDVHYLCNSGVEIDGLKFWGIPYMGQVIIPEDTDVLVTHVPPYGMCDLADYGKGLEHRGDKMLMKQVMQVQPRYHLFGHEHDAYGVMKHGDVVFSNASVMDSKYRIVNKPRLFRI